MQNFQNQHLWTNENPHAILPSRHQQWFSIKIWAGICGDILFGPHILPNRHTGQIYKAFLENNIPDFLAAVPLIIRPELHFVNDAATSFCLNAHRYLNQKFPWSVYR
jgi:hypothetical protein